MRSSLRSQLVLKRQGQHATAVDFSDIASPLGKTKSRRCQQQLDRRLYRRHLPSNNKITRADDVMLVNRVLKRLPRNCKGSAQRHDDQVDDNSILRMVLPQWPYREIQTATITTSRKQARWSKLRQLVIEQNWKSKIYFPIRANESPDPDGHESFITLIVFLKETNFGKFSC